ncbi:MAG: flagellar export chaperone FlgN [Planctomycetota bacterium]
MTTPATQLDPTRLIGLLEQQRDLYQKLRELSEKQRALIARDRPELLLTILRERQDLVAALARLNEELGPFRRQWDAVYATLPEAERARASSLLQEINGLLRVILRTDQEDGALLSVRKQAVAAEIAGLSGGRTANVAYARNSGVARGPAAADLTG